MNNRVVQIHGAREDTDRAPVKRSDINIRATLEYALDRDMIDLRQRDMLLKIARSMYYPDRSYHAMVKKGVED